MVSHLGGSGESREENLSLGWRCASGSLWEALGQGVDKHTRFCNSTIEKRDRTWAVRAHSSCMPRALTVSASARFPVCLLIAALFLLCSACSAWFQLQSSRLVEGILYSPLGVFTSTSESCPLLRGGAPLPADLRAEPGCISSASLEWQVALSASPDFDTLHPARRQV